MWCPCYPRIREHALASGQRALLARRRLGLGDARQRGLPGIELGGRPERLVVALGRRPLRPRRRLGGDVRILGRDRRLAHDAPSTAGAPQACSTSGTPTVPSSRWPFSSSAIRWRQVTAVPFNVATKRGLPPPAGR